jgi:peptidylprolyl isomerase
MMPSLRMGATRRFATILAAAMSLSCAGAPFPRETRATNGRTDDPWLEGTPCAGDAPEDVGLRIEELDPGSGKPVGRGETVRVHYVAQLPDGTTVHNTREGGPPIEIIIGSTKTICGFERALLGMRAGGERRVLVPWRAAFGEGGRLPDVKPRTDLLFVVDLYLPADVVTEHGGPPVNPMMGPRRQ